MAKKKDKKPHRLTYHEMWTLSKGGNQIGLISRCPGHGQELNVYLNGSIEPVRKKFTDWEEAKDFVFQQLKIARGHRKVQ